jgi:hypothetical protein
MSIIRELLALTEAVNFPLITRKVAKAMRNEYDATFTDDEYVQAAAWLIQPRWSRPGDAAERVINMFKKLHGRDITDRQAYALMYQQFVTKPNLDREVHRAKVGE